VRCHLLQNYCFSSMLFDITVHTHIQCGLDTPVTIHSDAICNCLHDFVTNVVKLVLIGKASLSWLDPQRMNIEKYSGLFGLGLQRWKRIDSSNPPTPHPFLSIKQSYRICYIYVSLSNIHMDFLKYYCVFVPTSC
jgi:hypothetical protein